MVSAFTDYRYDFGPLERAVDNFTKGLERRRRLDELGQVGQSLTGENPDYGSAAARLMALGELGGATNLLTLKEATAKRGLAEAATRGLADALGGGSSLSSLGQSVSGRPTGSALPTSLNTSESGGDWTAQNSAVGAGGARGHFGRAQFGQARLQEAADAGAIPAGTTPQAFMASPELQKSAENWHFADIDKFIAGNGLDRVIGRSIGGVPATLEGMRAVAHLGGKEGLAKFIASGGRYNPSDANGTSLMDYFRQHGGRQTVQADIPAPGAVPAALAGTGNDYAIPGQPAMDGRTFDAITSGEPQLRPAFEAEGVAQPWMGSALQRSAPVAQAPRQPLPPQRPYDLAADLPARDAVPAIGQIPQPQAAMPDYTNAEDGGSRAFAMSQGRNAPPSLNAPAGSLGPAKPQQAMAPVSIDTSARPTSDAQRARADLPAAGAVPAEGPSATPRLTADMPRPNSRETMIEYGATRQMELAKGQAGKLAAALANPNLPANARAVGEIFLKEALEQSKAPDSVKEFVYARSMGWTTAKSPNEYAAERDKTKKSDASETVEERKAAAAKAGLKPGDAGYQGFILTGKMPREDAGPLSATDKKAILEADEMVVANQSLIDNLRQAKELSAKAYAGPLAGLRGQVTGTFGNEAGQATSEYNNLVTTNALAQLKPIFGGNPTEGERKILLDIQGSANLPHDLRVKILDRGIAMAERRMVFNQQRAAELRGGDFYKSPEKRGAGGTSTPSQGSSQPRQSVSAPSAAVEFLKANPGARDQFDAKYGAGSAANVLGQ